MSNTSANEPSLDHAALADFVSGVWDQSIVAELTEYIAIPNKSPAFDPDWEEHGYMAQAVELIAGWCRAQEIEGLTLEVVQITRVGIVSVNGRTSDELRRP